MIWLIGGLVYMGAYALAASLIADTTAVRLWFGNIGLLIPPLAPIVVVLTRRREWGGHQRVFWDAFAVAAVVWLAAQLPLAAYEVGRQGPLPWLNVMIVPQLCASLMPLLALVARPHRGQRRETAMTAVLDLYVLALLAAFVYWSLLILPGMAPARAESALRTLTIVGPSVRVAVFVGFMLAMRAVGPGAWARAYRAIGLGALVSFLTLTALGWLVVDGSYRTGSPFDVGWMAPFWFWAWAAAIAPAKAPEAPRSLINASRPSRPTLLFAALCLVPLIGFGGRYFMPLPEPLERYRELITGLTLAFGLALAMVRAGVERRALRYADRQIRLLAAACEQSDELIVIVRTGAIRYANPAFCRVSGYSPDDLGDLTPDRLGAPGSQDIVSRLEHAESRGEMTRVTTTIRRKDGTVFPASCTIAPIVDRRNDGTHLVCVMRDLTEDISRQEQMVRFERMSAIGELLSGVALELSSPLQSVVGSLELMRQAVGRDELEADLDRASREADRAVRLVKNLLVFVKRSPSERMLADFSELVQSAVAARLSELRANGIELREEYAGGLPLVQVNRDEVRQAVVNLIINAERAMASTAGPRVLTVRASVAGLDARLDVSDTGPGVPPEVARRIFEPFFSPRDTGVGLGLSAAFGIVEAHGGTLELIAADVGATFRLTLPGAGFAGPIHRVAGGVGA
jgi:PAS domain S-box-containing protein